MIKSGEREGKMPAKTKSKNKKDVPSTSKGIKLRRIEITNFKAIDHLMLEFPPPRMKVDPDVIVMGSSNGVGKTSVLEAISLLYFLISTMPIGWLNSPNSLLGTLSNTFLLRAGTGEFKINGNFELEKSNKEIKVAFAKINKFIRYGGMHIDFDNMISSDVVESIKKSDSKLDQCLYSLLGLIPEPLILSPFLYFHSHRKISDINPGSDILSDKSSPNTHGNGERAVSPFKYEILRAMMSEKELTEVVNKQDAAMELERLNDLMKEFSGCELGKLSFLDNSIQILVKPVGSADSFPIDGLSSGQKEIISMLFLIWKHTKNKPGIVLIDEPELHLNAEWHRKFIRMLFELGPENQYIITTHSQVIFGSVDSDRRILLEVE